MSKKIKNRYTDKELESFRKIINEKIEKAKTDLDLLKSAYMNDSNNGTCLLYTSPSPRDNR